MLKCFLWPFIFWDGEKQKYFLSIVITTFFFFCGSTGIELKAWPSTTGARSLAHHNWVLNVCCVLDGSMDLKNAFHYFSTIPTSSQVITVIHSLPPVFVILEIFLGQCWHLNSGPCSLGKCSTIWLIPPARDMDHNKGRTGVVEVVCSICTTVRN